MIKITGALVVIGTFLYMGLNAAMNLKKRADTLSDMMSALQIIKSEISHKFSSLPEIMLLLKKQGGNTVQNFFGAVYEKMNVQTQSVFCPVWIGNLSLLYYLNEKDRQIIGELGSMLGQYDANVQEESIMCLIKRLELRLKGAEEEYDKKGKLYKTLGMGLGIITVLAAI